MYESVKEFHEAFNIFISDKKEFSSEASRTLRRNLLIEEVTEFLEASKINDIIEQADGLIDTLYIAYGTALTYGFVPEIPISRDSSRRFPNSELKELNAAFMHGMLNRYLEAENKNDFELVVDLLERIIQLSLDILEMLNLPTSELFDEVHASNMSKLGLDGKPIYREDGKVMKGPNFFKPRIAFIIGEE